MIEIKNTKIFTCNRSKPYHWSKLPKMVELMKHEELDLSNADLRGADLSNADLSNMNLISYADLSNANLFNAILRPIGENEVIIKDFFIVQGLGSINRQTIIFNTNIGIVIKCGCFYGTDKQFLQKVKETHGNNQFAREYEAMIELAKVRFERGEED